MWFDSFAYELLHKIHKLFFSDEYLRLNFYLFLKRLKKLFSSTHFCLVKNLYFIINIIAVIKVIIATIKFINSMKHSEFLNTLVFIFVIVPSLLSHEKI